MFAYPDKLKHRVCQFMVLPACQRQGHGRRLMASVLGAALDDDEVSGAAVETFKTNVSSVDSKHKTLINKPQTINTKP